MTLHLFVTVEAPDAEIGMSEEDREGFVLDAMGALRDSATDMRTKEAKVIPELLGSKKLREVLAVLDPAFANYPPYPATCLACGAVVATQRQAAEHLVSGCPELSSPQPPKSARSWLSHLNPFEPWEPLDVVVVVVVAFILGFLVRKWLHS